MIERIACGLVFLAFVSWLAYIGSGIEQEYRRK
jgi:hypothetical protein